MPSHKLHHPTGVTTTDEVSGKWFPYGAGIDCHRDMVWACVLRPIYDTGRQRRDLAKFDTSPIGLKCLREWLEDRVPADQRRVLVESTSTYHFSVLWALPAWTRIVINPMLVGAAKRKTDRWDAQTLAHHCMAGTFPPYVLPTWEELALRTSYRRRVKIGATINRNTNALKTRMCMFGINAEFNVQSKVGRALFSSACRGFTPSVSDLRVKGSRPLAALEHYISALPQTVRTINDQQILSVEALRIEREVVFKAAISGVRSGEIELLLTVPFAREVGALCFLSEIGLDPRRRFSSLKSIVAYSGFDPSKRVSADSVTSHMPTGGARHLRRAYLQIAAAAIMTKGPLKDYGETVSARCGKRGWHAARNAVGRKLIRWCAAVLISRKPFTQELDHGWKNETWEEHDGSEDPCDSAFDTRDGGGDDHEHVGPYEGIAPAPSWDRVGPPEDQGDER